MANYKIGKNNTIYANVSNLTAEEKIVLQMYINAGYIIKPKKETKKTAKASIKKDDMFSYIDKCFDKEKAEGIKTKFCYITKDHTYMTVLSWFKKNFPEYPAALTAEEADKKYKALNK